MRPQSGSKYDQLWIGLLTELRSSVEHAAEGVDADVAVAGLRSLGERGTWYGRAEVRGCDVISAPMAHLRSLANIVTAGGVCAAWPDAIFVFTVDTHGSRLRVALRDLAARSGAVPSPSRGVAGTPTPVTRPAPPVSAKPSANDPTHACPRIHAMLRRLPAFRNVSDVPFANGLYFFYENGESSSHDPDGRVVRIGNHPRTQDRLVARLGDHFRSGSGAKNGSVFRRYLGGALMRRRDPSSKCLQPGPGQGHWERQDVDACPTCAGVEGDVKAYITENLTFRCVGIDDLAERNRFEMSLLATLAACTSCLPSPQWLGLHAYPQAVRSSGLWNVQHVDGPTISLRDLDRFAELVEATATPAHAKGTGRLDRTLLVIPCSGGKDGTADPGLGRVAVADFLGDESRHLLQEGRARAFARRGVMLDETSELRPAIAYYTGQPYATPGVRAALVDAIARGLHCLIVSGGYGLLRAEEPIHRYNAYLGNQTRDVWSRRLPVILRDYVARNEITRAVVVLSSAYAAVLPDRIVPDEIRIVPTFDRAADAGSPMRVVPERVGRALARVLADL